MEETSIPLDTTAVLFASQHMQVRRMIVEPGKSVPRHYHTECTDTIFPLSGKAELVTDDRRTTMLPDHVYTVRPPDVHTIVNNERAVPFVYLLIQEGKYDFITVNE